MSEARPKVSIVRFYEDELQVVGENLETAQAVVRPFCEALGLDPEPQRKKLQEATWSGAALMEAPADRQQGSDAGRSIEKAAQASPSADRQQGSDAGRSIEKAAQTKVVPIGTTLPKNLVAPSRKPPRPATSHPARQRAAISTRALVPIGNRAPGPRHQVTTCQTQQLCKEHQCRKQKQRNRQSERFW